MFIVARVSVDVRGHGEELGVSVRCRGTCRWSSWYLVFRTCQSRQPKGVLGTIYIVMHLSSRNLTDPRLPEATVVGLGETEFFGGRHGTCSHCSRTRRVVAVVVLADLGNGTWHSGTRCRGTRPITGCSRSRSEGNLAFPCSSESLCSRLCRSWT